MDVPLSDVAHFILENHFNLKGLSIYRSLKLDQIPTSCVQRASDVILKGNLWAVNDILDCRLWALLVFLWNVSIGIADVFVLIILRPIELNSVTEHLVSVVLVEHEKHPGVLQCLG